MNLIINVFAIVAWWAVEAHHYGAAVYCALVVVLMIGNEIVAAIHKAKEPTP